MVNIDATTPQLKVVKDWIEAHSSLNPDNAEPHVSKHFKLQSYPKSAHPPHETREDYFKKHKKMAAATTKAETTIHEIIEAPGKVVIHATGKATTADGATHDFETFSIITLVEEDGELKILEVKDFAVPEHRNNFHGGIDKAHAHISKLSGGLEAEGVHKVSAKK